MATNDFYALLDAEPDATAAELEAAYRRVSLRLTERADAHGQDVQNQLKFLRIARDSLLHEGRRAAYDASRNAVAAPRTPPGPAKPAKPANSPLLMGAAALAAALIGLGLYWQARKTPEPAAPSQSAALALGAPVLLPADARAGEPGAARHLSSEELFEKTSQSVVVIYGLNGESKVILQGSGVVVGEQKIITNCHVAKSAAATIIKMGEQRYPAILSKVDADPEHDLCLLNVEGVHAPAVSLADIASVRVGQKVFALGAPKGLELTMSDGIVSSLRTYGDSHFVQTTASISPGSSGGGLFDETGALVGITTFQRVDGQNLNFAVPVDWVAALMEKNDGLASIGGESLGQLQGRWRCEPSKGTIQMLYQFGKDGDFSVSYSDAPNVTINGSYGIMGNHTLVLKSAESDPPEVYVQILALDRSGMRVSSPFYDEAQTYQCSR